MLKDPILQLRHFLHCTIVNRANLLPVFTFIGHHSNDLWIFTISPFHIEFPSRFYLIYRPSLNILPHLLPIITIFQYRFPKPLILPLRPQLFGRKPPTKTDFRNLCRTLHPFSIGFYLMDYLRAIP